MLDTRENFWIDFLRVVTHFSEHGVDPRKHANPRPMGLNICCGFSHRPQISLVWGDRLDRPKGVYADAIILCRRQSHAAFAAPFASRR